MTDHIPEPADAPIPAGHTKGDEVIYVHNAYHLTEQGVVVGMAYGATNAIVPGAANAPYVRQDLVDVLIDENERIKNLIHSMGLQLPEDMI